MLTIEKKSLSVGKYVDSAHVDNVIKNYKQERWVQNSKNLGKEDSMSVWWSVEELEQFLQTVKDNGGDGLRMYFAAYDKEYDENPLFAGRQTIVMVGTKQKETVKGSSDKDIYVTTEKGNSILAYNAGMICPPYCRPATGDGFDELGIGLVDKGDEGFVVV